MRVLVTGSREWTAHEAVWVTLSEIAKTAADLGDTEMVVVHGCARGVDSFADSWVRTQDHPLPVRAERHPANWAKFGRRAGFVRNQGMVDRGADVCVAFIRDGSRVRRSARRWLRLPTSARGGSLRRPRRWPRVEA